MLRFVRESFEPLVLAWHWLIWRVASLHVERPVWAGEAEGLPAKTLATGQARGMLEGRRDLIAAYVRYLE